MPKTTPIDKPKIDPAGKDKFNVTDTQGNIKEYDSHGEAEIEKRNQLVKKPVKKE